MDYVKFKIKEKGAVLKLDDKGNLSGTKELIDDLKVQLPNQFTKNAQKINEIKLPQSDDNKGVTKEQFNKMSYQERLKLFNENKEAYDELTKSNE